MHLLLLFRGPDAVSPLDVSGGVNGGGGGGGSGHAPYPRIDRIDEQNRIAMARVIAFITAGSMQ